MGDDDDDGGDDDDDDDEKPVGLCHSTRSEIKLKTVWTC